MKALIFLTFITCISQVVGAIRIKKRKPVKDASFDAGVLDTIFKAKVKLSKGEIVRGVAVAKIEFQLKNPSEGNLDWEIGIVKERSNPASRVFNCIFDTTLPNIPGDWEWRLRATDSDGTTKTSVFYLMIIAEGYANPPTTTTTSRTLASPTSSIALSVSKANFAIGEDIVVNFNFPNTFGNGDCYHPKVTLIFPSCIFPPQLSKVFSTHNLNTQVFRLFCLLTALFTYDHHAI